MSEDFTPVTMETTVVRADDLSIAELDGEMVVLDVQSGQYYGLNEVGARILQLTDKQITLQHVVDQLLEEYEVSTEKLRADVIRFVRKMGTLGLVQVVENGVVS